MSKLTDQIERKNSLLADATQLVQAGLKTAEAKEQYRAILVDVDDADDMIAMLKRVETVLPNMPAPVAAPTASRGGRESKKVRKAKLNAAFRAYLQGKLDQRVPEHRAIVTSTDAGGGAVVPQEFRSVLSEALKLWAPLMSYANTIVSSRSVKSIEG